MELIYNLQKFELILAKGLEPSVRFARSTRKVGGAMSLVLVVAVKNINGIVERISNK